ncbi:10142_t:CDS:2 [Diversispora eburnea]|uniref:10142_t:CDS:1 n=1 Tax=Diversispora eburnea TaxID=1213867 RepID=A0A9N8V3F2_9GLOM|nr:10142_t:CDS:2 [Diversispora eburnea]
MISKFISVTILFYYLEKVSAPPNKTKSTFQNAYKREGIGMFLPLLAKIGRLELLMTYGFYVYLMYQQEYSGKSEYTNNDLPRLSEWDSTYIVVIISEIIGITLRLWCYKTLDEFFTFDLTIQKDHKLITREYSGKPEYTSNNLPRLSEWDNIFIVVSILKIIGIALRLWCYKTLDEFFTFDVTIQKDHKLITHASQLPSFIKLYESSLSPITYSIFSFSILMCVSSFINRV